MPPCRTIKTTFSSCRTTTFHCFKPASQRSPEIINFLRYIEMANKEGIRKCSYSIPPALRVNPQIGIFYCPQKGVVTNKGESPRPPRWRQIILCNRTADDESE